jgi:hypothetical protein
MRSLDLPAGSTIRLTATARPNVARHRWDMLVFTAGGPGDAHPRLTFGSEIGGDDREQRIDVPAQDKDCRVEVTSRHAIAGGWKDDFLSIDQDTPALLTMAFSDSSAASAQRDDVLLSFAFAAAAPANAKLAPG